MAVVAELAQRPLDKRQLDEHQIAAQVGEARARQVGPALHVDALAGQLQVIAGLGRDRGGVGDGRAVVEPVDPRFADGLQDGVLERRVGVRQVGQPRLGAVELLLDLRQLLLQRLGLGRDLAHVRHGGVGLGRVPGLLGGLLGLRDRLVGRVLLGPQRLELGQDLAPPLVEAQHAVEGLRVVPAAASEGGAGGVGIAAQGLQVEHHRAGYPARAGRGRAARARPCDGLEDAREIVWALTRRRRPGRESPSAALTRRAGPAAWRTVAESRARQVRRTGNRRRRSRCPWPRSR